MNTNLQSIKYSRGLLLVVDQLQIPYHLVYVNIKDAADAWNAIRSMQVRGAPLIALTAVLGLAVELWNCQEKFESVDQMSAFFVDRMKFLQTSRPTAVNLFSMTNECLEEMKQWCEEDGISAKLLIDRYVSGAENRLQQDLEVNKRMGSIGADRIIQLIDKEKITVLTICNTGSLATAGYGTALGVVRALYERGKLEQVYACETRPYNQGARLTAFEIVQDGLPGTLIVDSMASALMAVKSVDCVIVGADRVAANGDTANKIGTYQLAIAAKFHNIPFFATIPTTTLDLSMASGFEIHVEERPAIELTSIFGRRIAPEGIHVWNPAFDVTPCHLIKGIITEFGVAESTEQYADSGIIPIAEYILSKAETIPLHLKSISTKLLERCHHATPPTSSTVSYAAKYERLEESKILNYICKHSNILKLLDIEPLDVSTSVKETATEALISIREIGDGNLNYVYLVESIKDPSRSVIIKQALPHVRCVGESWPLTIERAKFENMALCEHRKLAGNALVPEVYLFDEAKSLIVMQYIEPPHIILRYALMQQLKISTFASDIGTYLARTLFGSSALALDGERFRLAVGNWSRNTQMCGLTEQVIFTDPYYNSPNNRWTSPQMDATIQAMQSDDHIKIAASHFKSLFLSSTQALIHGDLHTGSVMVKEGSTFVIDPEFAFYGPMGFDIAAILSNLLLSYFSHYEQGHHDYAEWVMIQTETLYKTFCSKFIELWNEKIDRGNENLGVLYSKDVFPGANRTLISRMQGDYLKKLWRDCIGFTGMKMIRRIVGIAKVADIQSIEDVTIRTTCEKKCILFARKLICSSYDEDISTFSSIDGLIQFAKDYQKYDPAQLLY